MATKPGKTASGHINDPARTTAGILEVAIAEFAVKSLSGALIDAQAPQGMVNKLNFSGLHFQTVTL